MDVDVDVECSSYLYHHYCNEYAVFWGGERRRGRRGAL